MRDMTEETNKNAENRYTDPETGKFKEGNPGGGRPKGSISIKDRIRQFLQNNPDQFEELCQFYLKDRKMRDLLWKMLEGLPKQSTEISGELGLPFSIKIIKDEPKPDTTKGEDSQAVSETV